MFLLNPNDCARNWEDVKNIVEEIIQREGGKIVLAQKFDDLRLAYEVAGHKRGTYYLAHFEAEGDAIARIRGRTALAEPILRAMILVDEDGPVEIPGSILQVSRMEMGPRRDMSGSRRPRERQPEGAPARQSPREAPQARQP